MKISEKLKQLKEKGEGALAMFATAGDPDMETSLEVFKAMGRGGTDLIEIGIPYSDPLMDGPVLQQSYERALKNGFKLKNLPGLVESVIKETDAPSLIMTCFNPIYRYGPEKFFRDIASAGADSVLLTDMPPEEYGDNMELARQNGLGTIFLVTPTTPPDRMKMIDGLSSPFVYCVSKVGITGSDGSLPDTVKEYVDGVRKTVKNPVLVGFGITKPEEAKVMAGVADGIVVGSALVKIVDKEAADKKKMLDSVEGFVRGLKEALRA